MLTQRRFKKIAKAILQTGRPVERAYFAYHFLNADKNDIIDSLAKFQNDDGGFGHGLEADNWNPNSTPLTTLVALRMLYDIEVDKEHPMVRKSIAFLGNNYFDNATGTWQTIIPSNNDYPHAPWWSYSAKGNNTWSFNPSIELAGLIEYFARPTDQAYLNAQRCFAMAKAYLQADNNKLKENFHEIYNYIAAADVSKDNELIQQQIKYIEETMCKDPDLWLREYVANPLDFLGSKYSPQTIESLQAFRPLMIKNAEALIDNLPERGLWEITWDWMGTYPEKFVEARQIWQASKAIEYLLKFRQLGLIEPEE